MKMQNHWCQLPLHQSEKNVLEIKIHNFEQKFTYNFNYTIQHQNQGLELKKTDNNNNPEI